MAASCVGLADGLVDGLAGELVEGLAEVGAEVGAGSSPASVHAARGSSSAAASAPVGLLMAPRYGPRPQSSGGRRRLGPGDWFGELALLRDCARTATVTAASDVRLHAVDRDTFLTALAGTPRSRGIAHEHAAEHYR